MAALTGVRNTPRLGDNVHPYDHPVKAATQIWAGSLVARDATGYLVPGSASTTQIAMGRAGVSVNNTGASGAVVIAVDQGVFKWANSTAGDLITVADVGKRCFIVDDQTVAKTNGSSTRSEAGTVVFVDSTGVWVETRFVA